MDNYVNYIFSKEITQQLQILELLYNNTNGLDTDELTKLTNLERRTIHKHLSSINEKANKEEKIQHSITSEKRKYIFSGDRSEYYTLKCTLVKSEPLLILFELFLSNTSVDFTNFCKKNFVSESTMKRKFQKANVLLSSIGSKITLKTNHIYIVGEERIIRYSLVALLWRVYRGMKWPFPDVDEHNVEAIINSIISSGRYISYGKRRHLAFYLAVFISRIQSGNNITKEFLPKYSEALICSNRYIEQLSNLLKHYFTIPDTELEFILLLFFIFPECYEEFLSTDNTLKLLKQHSPRSYSSIMHFVSFIKKRHPKWDSNHPESSLFWPMLISGRIFVDIFKNAFFNSSAIQIFKHAQTDYPNLLPTIEKSVLSHEPKLSENTLKSLTLRYGQAYIMEHSPHDFEPQIKILLLTDTAMYVERITQQCIENLLKFRFNFILEADLPTSTPDLILEADTIRQNYKNTRRLFINSEVSPKDRESILKICNKILKEKTKKSHKNRT